MNKPILSIVVPSKDRYETLNVLIESLMAWKERDFELIVQDNSDNNEPVLPLLEQFRNDKRLIYNHHVGQMAATENGDMGMSYATGHYVTLLGDDDGIVPQALEVCRWMLQEGVDALSCKRASYVWPDVSFKYKHNDHLKGKLTYGSYEGKSEIVSVADELNAIARYGGTSMVNIARLYHGFVKKECLDKVNDLCGTYFPGPVIDMSSAVSIVPYIDKYISIDVPVVISGNCSKSMAGKNLVKQHQGDIKSQKSLPADTEELWSSEIPRYWSGPTIWAETFIKACERSGQEKVLNNFNAAYVYAGCFAYTDAKYYPIIWRTIKDQSFSKIAFLLFNTPWILFKISMSRFSLAFKKRMGMKHKEHIKECRDIDEVIKLLEKEINLNAATRDFSIKMDPVGNEI